MRLTLRTLLAYLDDVLDAESTKEIGKKIHDSEYASTLVERIKQVTRQRRLMAPELEPNKNHLDANTVAEYLDNTAESADVANIEKVCLESDVELAEVATVHQVLTLIIGEPVDIPPETRERMYRIVPHGQSIASVTHSSKGKPAKGKQKKKTDPDQETPFMEVTKSSHEFRLPAKIAEDSEESTNSFKEELPDYISQKSSSSLRTLLIIALILILAFGGLLYLDPDFRHTIQSAFYSPDTDTIAQVDNEAGEGEPVLGEPADTDEPTLTEPVTEEPTTEPEDSTSEQAFGEEVETETKVTESESPEPQPQPIPVEPAPVEPAPAEMTKPDETEVAVVTKPEEEPVKPETPPLPVEPAPVVPVPPPAEPQEPVNPPVPVQYVSNEGIFLRFDENEKDWFTLPYRSMIQPNERLASPYPFISTLKVDQGACHLAMLGGTTAEIQPSAEGAKLGLNIRQGQVVISGHPHLEENNKLPYEMDLVLGANTWRLVLLSADVRVGIDIKRAITTEPQEDLGTDTFTGMLHVVSGSAQFADGTGQVVSVNENQSLSLTPADVRAARPVVNNVDQKGVAIQMPEWLDPKNIRISPAVRSAKRVFETLFVPDEKVTQSLSPAISHKNPIMASWVVQCLGQTGDVRSVTRALTLPDQPLEVIHNAAYYLKVALATSAEVYEPMIVADLETAMAPEDIESLVRLLWGFDESAAKDPQISQQIINWMAHDSLAIREMAFQYAQQFTGRNFSYRSQATTEQINQKVQRWQKFLDQNGGTLIKE